jgi:hypothetical protein
MLITLLLAIALLPAIPTAGPERAYASDIPTESYVKLVDGTRIAITEADIPALSPDGGYSGSLPPVTLQGVTVERTQIEELVFGTKEFGGVTGVGDNFLAGFFQYGGAVCLRRLDLRGFTSLTTVGNNFALAMFRGSSSLTSLPEDLNLPQGITSVGTGFCSSMFLNCLSLESLPEGFNLPQGITALGMPQDGFVRSMFSGCSSLVSLPDGFNLPQGLTSVSGATYNFAENMFYGCSSLISLPDGFNLPQGLTSVGVYFAHYMFSGCSSLISLPDGFNLPQSLTNVRISAFGHMFFGCSSLTSLPLGFNLPQGVTGGENFARGMFYGCALVQDVSGVTIKNPTASNIRDFSNLGDLAGKGTLTVACSSPPPPYALSFDTEPTDVEVRLYADAEHTQELFGLDGAWNLDFGQYHYVASAEGYLPASGTVRLAHDRVVALRLDAVALVRFTLSPADAVLTVFDTSGKAVAPVSAQDGECSYLLNVGDSYTYLASAPGYASVSQGFLAMDGVIDVTLALGSGGGGTEEVVGSTLIVLGGTYHLAEGLADADITIATTDEVTIIGNGVGGGLPQEANSNIGITAAVGGTHIVLRDVFIRNETDDKSVLDFVSEANTLVIEGTCLLELQPAAYGGAALVHVPPAASLTTGGTGTLYFYKSNAGAGFGGDIGEANGAMGFEDLTLFGKGTKQGAVIGTGADAEDTVCGDITFSSGEYAIIANARGALIGGGAGPDGGASGGEVFVDGGALCLNVDFTGAAIGGGGHASGNDAAGGMMHYSGGSVRTYIDENALDMWGVDVAGVNDSAITAKKVGSDGEEVHLLTFDTTTLADPADSFTVQVDGRAIYSGGLHRWRYINESLPKGGQLPIDCTLDNWEARDDPNLYLYLTDEECTLDVNGELFAVSFDEASGTFSLTPFTDGPSVGEPGSGDLNGDRTATAAEALQIARAAVYGYGEWDAALKAAADMDGDGAVTLSDAYRALRKAAGL